MMTTLLLNKLQPTINKTNRFSMEEKRTDGIGFIIVGVVVASGRCGAIPLIVLRFGGVVSAAMRVGDIIGAKCQCKLVSWIGRRVRGGATMSA